MSQIPTNSDIPSNSHKSQEAAAQSKDPRPEVTPFNGETGSVKRKKSGFLAWCRKMFLSDRKPSEIMMDVLENQIVPGIKDNVRNSVVSSIDMFVYQSAKPASQTSSNNSVSYNNIFRAQTSQKNLPQQTQNSNEADLNNGFTNPTFKTKADAVRFLNEKMKAYDFPTLSVHTLYMMRGKHIDYTWDKYGWNKEEIASWDPNRIITHISSPEFPWMINLPQAHVVE